MLGLSVTGTDWSHSGLKCKCALRNMWMLKHVNIETMAVNTGSSSGSRVRYARYNQWSCGWLSLIQYPSHVFLPSPSAGVITLLHSNPAWSPERRTRSPKTHIHTQALRHWVPAVRHGGARISLDGALQCAGWRACGLTPCSALTGNLSRLLHHGVWKSLVQISEDSADYRDDVQTG